MKVRGLMSATELFHFILPAHLKQYRPIGSVVVDSSIDHKG